jgi:hypothetical protein
MKSGARYTSIECGQREGEIAVREEAAPGDFLLACMLSIQGEALERTPCPAAGRWARALLPRGLEEQALALRPLAVSPCTESSHATRRYGK